MMLARYKVLFSIALLVNLASNGYSQQRTAQEQRVQHMRDHYRRKLEIDSAKAEKIAQIHNKCWSEIKAVVSDTIMAEGVKQLKINKLEGVRNNKIRFLLNPSQQEKIFPLPNWGGKLEAETHKY